jgi:hypothetical protein
VLPAITAFLERRRKLKVNAEKSAVARPWPRKFLGYRRTWHREAKRKIAEPSRARFAEKVRPALRAGRGRSLKRVIEDLNPLLRGWVSYFRRTAVQGVLQELDGWIRHKLRTLRWRPWKRNHTGAENLMRAGLSAARAWRSATNGRGPCCNGGAAHMHAAILSLASTAGDWFRCWILSAAPLAGFMNRRMRNRKSGGVGGRRE